MNKNIPLLSGKWVVHYNPETTSYASVLESLADFTPTAPNSSNQPENGSVFYRETLPDTAAQLPSPPLSPLRALHNLLLAYPVRMNDKRWETIQFTTSSLFLGSTLTHAGFDVSTARLHLPPTPGEVPLSRYHLIGLTLFEDLFKETLELLDFFNTEQFAGIVAAGGPMVTLNPLECAWNFPGLNLLIRGEAEFILPRILQALKTGDLLSLLKMKGFLFQVPGLIIISDLHHIERPVDFSDFRFNLDFLEKKHLSNGIELNLSRGCRRGCIFCSRVQGPSIRKIPEDSFRQLLSDFSAKIDTFAVTSPQARTININDDDILQEPDYARRMFRVMKDEGYKLWGVQTSLNSFFHREKGDEGRQTLNAEVLEIVADKSLYVEDKPLVWLGTDAFLKERGKKLAKSIPSEAHILALSEEFEKKGIRNYHYWISSDYRSDWPEFAREFLFICRLQGRFSCFGLIAHAPYLVPYPSTPLYRLLQKSPETANRIRYKSLPAHPKPKHQRFHLPLVERVQTAYPHLNRLLDNEKNNRAEGFFDSLKNKDYLSACITLYNFLKQERLSFQAVNHPESDILLQTERDVEEFISTII